MAFNRVGHYLEYHPSYGSYFEARDLRNSFAEQLGKGLSLSLSTKADFNILDDGGWNTVTDEGNSLMEEWCNTGRMTGRERRSVCTKAWPEEERVDCLFVVGPGTYNLHHFLWELLPAVIATKPVIGPGIALAWPMADRTQYSFAEPLVNALKLGVSLQPYLPRTRVVAKRCQLLHKIPWRVYPLVLMRFIIKTVGEFAVARCDTAKHLPHEPSVVYLTRGDNERNRRPILNEDLVIGALKKRFRNLCVITPPKRPFLDVVRVLRSCKLVIGPHGGALNHFVWGSGTTHLHEIVPSSYPGMTDYEEIASLLNVPYSSSKSYSYQNLGPWSNNAQVVDIPSLMSGIDHNTAAD